MRRVVKAALVFIAVVTGSVIVKLGFVVYESLFKRGRKEARFESRAARTVRNGRAGMQRP
ncbi:hypothetical protein BH160DRAFT_0408 [Burkholderia sp. H160]|nr:hypothetical protein BH160DRAFT_0408 [Burkholderia sp. H160]